MESWDKKHETWAEEACWYDGTNANGTPRLDRAIKEAHELIDKGMTVRIFDLWDCTAHYINPDRGIAPNVLADRREPHSGEASSPKGDGRAAG